MPGGRAGVDEFRPWQLLTRSQIEMSPSFKEGMSFKTEKKLRETACKIINEAGKSLDQGIITIATAQTYLMRFFAIKSYQKNDSFIVAVAALFVASKTENKPRALIDIAHACWRHWIDIWVKEQKKRRKDKPLEYWSTAAASERNTFRNPELNQRMIEAASKAERVLLYTTGFQFSVPTAFWVLAGCKHRLKLHHDPAVARFFEELDLQDCRGFNFYSGHKLETNRLLEQRVIHLVVWNFVVESYCSTRQCLEFDPRTIGIACYELTCTQIGLQVPLVDGDVWWKYMAKVMEWDKSIGNPQDIRTIQDELRKIFMPSQSKKGPPPNGVRSADEQRSTPGTPLLPATQPATAGTPNASPPQPPAMVPSASGWPPSAVGPSEMAAPGTSGRPPLAAGNGHSKNLGAKLPASAAKGEPVRTDCGQPAALASASRNPTAQVKQKEEALAAANIRFSPSDEFAVSPRGSALEDSSAQTSLPVLLESGELLLEAAPERQQPVVAEKQKDKQKARLASWRAANLEKRKTEEGPSSLKAGEPDEKRRKTAELGAHFKP